jgi:hypothetical protein
VKYRIVKKPFWSSLSGDGFRFHPQAKFLGVWWEQADYGCLTLEDAEDFIRRLRTPAVPPEVVKTFAD